MKNMSTRMLATMAMLAAIGVVLARLIIPMPRADMRFSIEAVPIIIAGFMYGPIPGAIVGFVADIVGCLFSGYGFNPVFSVPPIMIGLSAGLLRFLLYKRVRFFRILLAFLPAVIFGSILWQSYWLSVIYGTNTIWFYLGLRSIQFSITAFVNAAVVYGLFKTRVFSMLGMWPPVNARIPSGSKGTAPQKV